ncbi:MAG: hypothetical protein HQK96_18585 [Nitrospirae bacterium]|nr:hypothetical protein [Nitrospirota bacterium]
MTDPEILFGDRSKIDIQDNGRIKYWAKVEELGNRFLRVITLDDCLTIHNAFLDRRFKEEDCNNENEIL